MANPVCVGELVIFLDQVTDLEWITRRSRDAGTSSRELQVTLAVPTSNRVADERGNLSWQIGPRVIRLPDGPAALAVWNAAVKQCAPPYAVGDLEGRTVSQ